MGFPAISGKWTMSLGIMPYSTVNYKIDNRGTVVGNENGRVLYNYTGSGGMNQFFFSNGVRISKNLMLGLRASYVFGRRTDDAVINIAEVDSISVNTSFLTTAHYTEKRYGDFVFQPGVHFNYPIAEKTTLNFGAVYEIGTNIRTFESERIETRRQTDFPVAADTILNEQRGNTTLPSKLGVGLSLSKSYNWTFGVDYYMQNWSNFRNVNGSNENLKNSYQIIVGAEFIPDFASVNSYLNRIVYQVGINYERTPIYLNNTQLNDFGINFGVSLPVGGASLVNLGFTYGQLGTTANGLIKEEYIQFRFGLTFNDRSFSWYRNQRKFN
jgi:hypothetical protein